MNKTDSKHEAKRLRLTKYTYCKIRRAITLKGAIEKSPMLLSQHWKN